MKFEIENIGKLNYLLTIVFGKNRGVKSFYVEKNKEVIEKRNFENDQMIVTIGKSTLIITEVIDGKRKPILVRKWKQQSKSKTSFANFIPLGVEYSDSQDNVWLHLTSMSKSESLTVKDSSGEKITLLFQ